MQTTPNATSGGSEVAVLKDTHSTETSLHDEDVGCPPDNYLDTVFRMCIELHTYTGVTGSKQQTL